MIYTLILMYYLDVHICYIFQIPLYARNCFLREEKSKSIFRMTLCFPFFWKASFLYQVSMYPKPRPKNQEKSP